MFMDTSPIKGARGKCAEPTCCLHFGISHTVIRRLPDRIGTKECPQEHRLLILLSSKMRPPVGPAMGPTQKMLQFRSYLLKRPLRSGEVGAQSTYRQVLRSLPSESYCSCCQTDQAPL